MCVRILKSVFGIWYKDIWNLSWMGYLNAFILLTSIWKLGLQLFLVGLLAATDVAFLPFSRRIQEDLRGDMWRHNRCEKWLVFSDYLAVKSVKIYTESHFLAYLLSCIHWDMAIRLWMLKPLYSTSKQLSDSSLHLCILRAVVQMLSELSIKVRVLVYKFQSH